ncbi:MAG: leucine-rich repeat protein, partial [Prevotella sp.]|nr:leucine-rich repeat protein [Prevotella sp.]
DIGEVFKGNTEITSFDELQYFTGLTKIGKEAFREATSLTSVVLPQSVKSIQSGWSFYGCSSLENVVLPDYLSMIDSYTFTNTAIKSIKLPEKGSVVLGYNVFTNTPLTNLFIPANLIGTIYQEVVSKCYDLISISVEEGNPWYDSREGCNAIIKTSTNTLIAGCKNTVIPESVKALGDKAFFYTMVKKLELPAGMTGMGATSLFHCDSLTSVVAHMPEPFTISIANIQGLPNNCVLTVPYGKRQAYIDAGWTESIFKGGVVEDKSQYDVNRDNTISIADVTKLVNVILGKP